MKSFTEGLKELNIDGLTYLIFGSFARDACTYGRSDIDGLLIFPDYFVINKDNFRDVKELYQQAKEGLAVPLQIQVNDMGNLQDGRFCFYEPQFKEQFIKEGVSLTGLGVDELVSKMNFRRFLDSNLNTAVPNFSQLRKGFLMFNFSEVYNDSREYEDFLNGFNNMLERTGRFATRFPYITNMKGHCPSQRFEGIGDLEKKLHLDLEVLREGRSLLTDTSELDKIYHKPKEMLQLWEDSLTLYETLVKEYCRRVEPLNF